MTSQGGRELRNRELQLFESFDQRHDPIVPLRDCQRAAPTERSPHAPLCLMLDCGGTWNLDWHCRPHHLITSSPHHIRVGRTYSSNRESGATGAFFSSEFVTICIKMSFFMPGMKLKKICKTFLTRPLDLTLIRARKKDVDMLLGVKFYSPWQPMGNRKGRKPQRKL